MTQIAKRMAVAMVIAVALTVTLAIIGGTTQPAMAHNGSHKCANVLEYPTDARCEAYTLYRYQYYNWSNDRYATRYYNTSDPAKRQLMRKAAYQTCHGTVYEDFSCDGYKA